jgi:transposase
MEENYIEPSEEVIEAAGDGKYKVEKPFQRAAFEYYYNLGKDRSYERVAEHTGKTLRTLYEWSRRFNWKDRCNQYDIEISRRLSETTISAVVEEKSQYRKLIKAMVGQIVKDFKDDKFRARNVSDLERLVKLDMLLLGESTEITKVNQTNTGLTESDREVIKEMASAIKAEAHSILDGE